MTDGQFYETKDDHGRKFMINVNNVALMTPIDYGTKVILNVKDHSDRFIEIITREDFNSISQSISYLDKAQNHKLEQSQED